MKTGIIISIGKTNTATRVVLCDLTPLTNVNCFKYWQLLKYTVIVFEKIPNKPKNLQILQLGSFIKFSHILYLLLHTLLTHGFIQKLKLKRTYSLISGKTQNIRISKFPVRNISYKCQKCITIFWSTINSHTHALIGTLTYGGVCSLPC